MKTITKEYEVYNFNELKDDVKQDVIDKWYQEEDYPFLNDNIMMELENIDKYFSNVELHYSLSYCQGDGLSFSGDFDLEKWLNDKYPDMKKSVRMALTEYIQNICSHGNTGRYCYSAKNQIDFTGNYDNYNKNLPHLEKEWTNILDGIQEYYIDLCNKLEKSGYDILEYRMNFEDFNEFCESNNYNFLENGDMVNY